jgi:hypothetical protein
VVPAFSGQTYAFSCLFPLILPQSSAFGPEPSTPDGFPGRARERTRRASSPALWAKLAGRDWAAADMTPDQINEGRRNMPRTAKRCWRRRSSATGRGGPRGRPQRRRPSEYAAVRAQKPRPLERDAAFDLFAWRRTSHQASRRALSPAAVPDGRRRMSADAPPEPDRNHMGRRRLIGRAWRRIASKAADVMAMRIVG